MKLMLLIVVHEVVIIAHLNQWTLVEGVFKLFYFFKLFSGLAKRKNWYIPSQTINS